jgi:hypothetical protein
VNHQAVRQVNKKSGKAILFLYEGDTEQGFYDALFEQLGIHRNTQIKRKCINGVYNLNKKVTNAIYDYLESNANKHVKQLEVFVAYDRDDKRPEPGKLNKTEISKFIDDGRLKQIHEIIATQMLESWFFIDIDGIYKFLRVQGSKRKPEKYRQYENFRHEDLDRLFRQFNPQKRYYKGERTLNFIENLDVLKIYKNCHDLKTGVDRILALANIKIPIV